METKTIKIDRVRIKADPMQMIEYAFYLKAQIKLLEEDLKDNEEMIIALLNSMDGKVSIDNDEVVGKATVCHTKTYKYSDSTCALIAKKKILESKIKAKQIVEIAEGAEIESISSYVRYNVEFK